MSHCVLGLNAYHGDASAALLVNGQFRAGVEEERLNRIKHWAGFPLESARAVLAEGGTSLREARHVAVSRNPRAHMFEKALFAFRTRPNLEAVRSRLANQKSVLGIADRLRPLFEGLPDVSPHIHNVEHHLAHLASAFFCAPFDEAVCLTVDGFGDFLSSMSAIGRGNRLGGVLDEVMFPHSLGILYTAVTQFLGFPRYGDEYKVMGLAPYGTPEFLPQMRQLVKCTANGNFQVDIDFFRHASAGVTESWDDGEPERGPVWSDRFFELFGPARPVGAPLTERHQNIAASLQAIYEEVFFHRLRWLQKTTALKKLCLAGGCAFNSVANGKIFRETDFTDVFIQSAAGDAGTALGAALYVWHQVLDRPRDFVMEHSYWGPSYGEDRILSALRASVPGFSGAVSNGEQRFESIAIRRVDREEELCAETAGAIARGEIVGWYQGRSEWGPRALGNRSIVVDPRRAEMKDILNARIKRREPFRPFAPSILEERVGDYFEESYPDPFMIKVYPVRPEKRAEIPAVTHVDGTGRLQTVSAKQNPRYHRLICAFERVTGVPVLLNTSFNENEPIVNTPEEALACFLRTKMHRVVLADWVVRRVDESEA